MKIVTSAEMRELEQRCAVVKITTDILMENAGLAFAHEAREIMGGVSGRRIMVLAGPGNNGGDGLVAARHLSDWGALVYVYLLGERKAGDKNLEQLLNRGLDIAGACLRRQAASDVNLSASAQADLSGLKEIISSVDVVIDAVFGTGKTRAIAGKFRDAFHIVKQTKKIYPAKVIISLDIPSGLDSDSGALDEAAIYADYTITLGYPKTGLYLFPGAEAVGKVYVVDIGIPRQLAEGIKLELLTAGKVKALLPPRPVGANKGSFGKAMIVAGSANYIGAAYLSGAAATRVGAGLVTMAIARSLLPILAVKLSEATFLPLPESDSGIISAGAYDSFRSNFNGYNALLIGCGMGQGQAAVDFMKQLIEDELYRRAAKIVIDADGLNNLVKIDNWWQKLDGDVILTPHPGEMARLTSMGIEEIQRDRVAVAEDFAVRWGKTIVLKGAFTVIASPDGRTSLSGVANPALATAGTGDVLAGAIAGLLAQGMSSYDASRAAVYIHARAGELLGEEIGDAGTTAGDLLMLLPKVIREVKSC